jgi:putative two-component system response regulator
VGIPDNIVKKPGKLDSSEWKIMKTHAQIVGQIFRDLREGLMIFDKDLYKVAEEIACSHHERWDGSGYPQRLKEHAIPLSAHIVAVADVFDAIT